MARPNQEKIVQNTQRLCLRRLLCNHDTLKTLPLLKIRRFKVQIASAFKKVSAKGQIK